LLVIFFEGSNIRFSLFRVFDFVRLCFYHEPSLTPVDTRFLTRLDPLTPVAKTKNPVKYGVFSYLNASTVRYSNQLSYGPEFYMRPFGDFPKWLPPRSVRVAIVATPWNVVN
jgi:hypothetical protein